ncbi:MAG TPA: hypothetical protein PKW82_03275 [Spirochaetales bacterium]|nr:hypothetical protein [Spirochaetales bacterium]
MSDDDDKVPAARYDRARRLSRASDEVRWLSVVDPAKRPGLLGALLATRGLRFIAFAAVLAVVSSGIVTFALGDDGRATLAGSVWTLSTLSHQGDALVTVYRKARDEAVGDLAVSIELGAEGRTERATLESFTDRSREQEFYLSLRGAGSAERLVVRLVVDGASAELAAELRRPRAP